MSHKADFIILYQKNFFTKKVVVYSAPTSISVPLLKLKVILLPPRTGIFAKRKSTKASYQNHRADMVPVAGVEPAPCCQDWILSPARLPIPSHRRVTIITHFARFCNMKFSLFPTLLRILCFSASFSRFFLK